MPKPENSFLRPNTFLRDRSHIKKSQNNKKSNVPEGILVCVLDF